MISITKTACFLSLVIYGAIADLGDKQSGSELATVIELPAGPVVPSETRDIDLALCLDTSGSMQGLIDSARQRLWALVNDLAVVQPTPHIRVALLTYGTPAYGEETGFVKIAVPLTEDLDMVSMRLFELVTSGGDEFVARVTQTAATQLDWSPDPKALKMIVVAGNEGAEQDPKVSLELACSTAIEKGIVVNALYCAQGTLGLQRARGLGNNQVRPTSASQAGATQTAPQQTVGQTPASAPTVTTPVPLDSVALGWKKVSILADGAFAMIDQSSGIEVIETPFDEKLILLSSALNETYIPYGSGSDWNLGNQRVQDSNAAGLNNEAAASRAQTKGGKLYVCSWDLVDALDGKQLLLADVKQEDLPKALRTLSLADLQAHVNEKRTARTKIQTEIAAVGVQREAWLLKKRAELGTDESMAFDTPLRKAFHELAEARGFQFLKRKPVTSEAQPVVEVVEPATPKREEEKPVTQTW